jgi:5-methylcytosine-specific restriction endonuclease McrA
MSFGIVCTTAAAFVVGSRRCLHDSAFFVPAPPRLRASTTESRRSHRRPFERNAHAHTGAERRIRTPGRRLVQESPRARHEREGDRHRTHGRQSRLGHPGACDRPAVIVLTRYVRVPGARRVPVTRRGVLRRDAHRCAYCGKGATTIDHVLPRSRGGADSWENLVAACLRCNNMKGDRTPQEMGWELRWAPQPPRTAVDGARHRTLRAGLGAVPVARRVTGGPPATRRRQPGSAVRVQPAASRV